MDSYTNSVPVDLQDNLYGAHAIQLPPGVGELIPNLLFIGPHGACEEMVKRFGVRYIIDVLEDKEVVSTVNENGYGPKAVALREELQDLRKRIVVLQKEELLRSQNGSENSRKKEECAEECKAAETPTEDDTAKEDAAPEVSTALTTTCVKDCSASPDEDTAVEDPLPPVDTASSDQHVAPSADAALSVEESQELKRVYLQLVADIRTATVELQSLEKRKAEYEAIATAETSDNASEPLAAAPTASKKKSDYDTTGERSVISPLTAAEGYEVVYPPAVSVMHFHMCDTLIEDLTVALNMGKPTAGSSASIAAQKKKDTDELSDNAALSPNSRGPNGFVTMDDLLAKFPPPVYAPPYALVDYLDAVLGQNPSESDLHSLSIAAIRKQAAAINERSKQAQSEREADPSSPIPSAAAFDHLPIVARHAVYIHCFAGKSRSASMAIAFAMMGATMGHRTLDEVMDLLAFMTPLMVKRPQGFFVRRGQGCRPNPRFMRDLIALEEQVQQEMQLQSGLPASRCRPFETAFDIDSFNIDGLVELFSNGPNPLSQIPEEIVIDTYEKVCHGDVIQARRLLVNEQMRLLVSPRVRQEMYVDNIIRVLDQDIDYYMLERKKVADGVYDDAIMRAVAFNDAKNKTSADERKKQLDAKIRTLQTSTPRQLVASVLEECEFNEEKALGILRKMRNEKIAQQMKVF